jgi:hypothetical protein
MKILKLPLLKAVLLGMIAITTVSCAEDAVDGVNGQDGVNGSNGTNGTDGLDGKDGKNFGEIDFTNSLKTSKTPNLLKVSSEFSSISVKPILSTEDTIPESKHFVYGSMADGAGLIANENGTFTLINNIEADYSIARIYLNSDLEVAYGEYIVNAQATASTAQCSGSLISPEEHGFGPLYLSGGEWGGASKGVFLTNPWKPTKGASSAKMLNAFGQWSTENAVVIGKDAYAGKTVAFIGDDHSDNATPSGQLGMYVGDHGDLEGGKLYGLKVTSAGIVNEVDMAEGTEYNAECVELLETEISALDAECKTKGVMGFSRLEDIDWRRGAAANQRELYFCVTGRNKADLVGKGSLLGRIYKVELNDTDPTGAAKITCVLDGDKDGGKADGFHSPDNILVTENYAYIQEDPNGYAATNPEITGFAKMYQYNLTTGDLKTVLECDQTTAETLGYGHVGNYWEITGMIDVTDVVNNGKNTFMLITQNHGWNAKTGQLFTDYDAVLDAENHWATEGSTLYTIEGLER